MVTKQDLLFIKRMGTWKPAFLLRDKNLINTKWMFTWKTDSTGNVTRCSARLVAKGFTQSEGMDYAEVFAPVSKYISLHFLLALVMKLYEVLQLDVENAFLNGMLSEEIYLEILHSVNLDNKSWNCFQLRYTQHRLKQAAWVWHEKLDRCLSELGFKK